MVLASRRKSLAPCNKLGDPPKTTNKERIVLSGASSAVPDTRPRINAVVGPEMIFVDAALFSWIAWVVVMMARMDTDTGNNVPPESR